MRSAREAVILFDSRTDTSVLACDVVSGPADFELGETGCFSAVLQGQGDCGHVVVGDGLNRLRLDVHGGAVESGPVRLRFRLEGVDAIEAPLLTLRRLSGLNRLRRMPQQLFPAEARVRRWTHALRALDAQQAGASQREVAEALFGLERVRTDWNQPSDYMRSQVRRMLRGARQMSRGGWRTLLASRPGVPLHGPADRPLV